MQAIVVVVDGDGRMKVFGLLSDREMESYEVEEGMSEMKCGKASGLDQCAVEFLRKGAWLWLVRLLNCCLETGRVPRDWCGACIVPPIRERGTDASAVTLTA